MELIVISDLHLSAGYNKETMKYSRNEDFFFDEEFKRFLEHLQGTYNKTNFHLIIAGDMFDFLQVNPDDAEIGDCPKTSDDTPLVITKRKKRSKYGLGTEEDNTVLKLQVIAKGHEVFFHALANFLSEGNLLSIITGNHDIELYWNKVQKELIALVGCNHSSNNKQIENPIRFYPWFYYDKEYKTYIEHGNQYDPLNSFQYFLCPLLTPDSARLWLPFGSLFVRYFFNRLEISNPFADNIKPPTKYMRWAWKEDKLQFIKNIVNYLPTMVYVFLRSKKLPTAKKFLIWRLFKKTEKQPESEKKSLEKLNNDKLEKLAIDFGLPLDTVKSINSLKAAPFTRYKLLNISTFSFFIIAVTAFIVLFCVSFYKYPTTLDQKLLQKALYSWQKSLYPFKLMLIPFVRWALRFFPKDTIKQILVWIQEKSKGLISMTAKWALKFFHKSHFEKALQIKRHLKDGRVDVQTIIFGHTHDPDIDDIRKIDKDFRYFNTGTWTTVFSEDERIIREEKQFAFVWIKKNNGKLDPGLYRWNDCLKQPENLIIFEPKPPEVSLIIRISRALYNSFSRLFTRSHANEKKEDDVEDKQK